MAQRRNMRRSPDAYSRGDVSRESRYDRTRSSSRGTSTRNASYDRRSSQGSRSRGYSSSYDVRPLSLRTIAILGAVVALACVLIVFVAVPMINSDQGSSDSSLGHAASEVKTFKTAEDVAGHFKADEGAKTQETQQVQEHEPYEPTVQDILSIPGSNTVITLDLKNGASTPTSASDSTAAIQSAIADVEKYGNCGFVFVNMSTGAGLAYNADKAMYAASATKAPFVFWLLTSGTELGEYDRQSIEWVIIDSDNESFEDLFASYYDDAYVEMMRAYGVEHEDYEHDYYPKMSARSLSGLWTDVLTYVRGGSADAQWLADLCGSTATSFIRDGLEGTGAVVMDKAGWILEASEYYTGDLEDEGVMEYDSVTDAGLISIDGKVYLMAIVTDQPDGDNAEQRVSTLARALFDARLTM